MKQTAKQELLSKYVCLADTEERRMLIEMSAEKGGVEIDPELADNGYLYFNPSFNHLRSCCEKSLEFKRKLIDTTQFCKYLLLSEEECEKVLNEGRRVDMEDAGFCTFEYNSSGYNIRTNANNGYSFIAYNAKGERIETNEPIKSIELWKD